MPKYRVVEHRVGGKPRYWQVEQKMFGLVWTCGDLFSSKEAAIAWVQNELNPRTREVVWP